MAAPRKMMIVFFMRLNGWLLDAQRRRRESKQEEEQAERGEFEIWQALCQKSLAIFSLRKLSVKLSFLLRRRGFPPPVKKTHRRNQKNVVGPRVRQARLRGSPPVSQEDLSGRLAMLGIGITQTGISKIENQDRYVMDYEAKALAKALKVSVAWLYDEESPGKSIAPLARP